MLDQSLKGLLLGCFTEEVSDPGEEISNEPSLIGLIYTLKQLSFHFFLKPLIHFDLKVSL